MYFISVTVSEIWAEHHHHPHHPSIPSPPPYRILNICVRYLIFWWANMSSHQYDHWNCSGLGLIKVIQGHSGQPVLEKTFWNMETVGRSVHVALCMFHWFCPHNLVQLPTCFHPTGLFWPGWRARDLPLSPSPFFNTTVGLCKLSRTCFIHSIYPVSIVYHEHVWIILPPQLFFRLHDWQI